jgi:NADH dehydrogenase/NADH:ubiquinone oxidoreductase subunit G
MANDDLISKQEIIMVNVTINNAAVSVEEGTSVLAAAKKIGIKIPTYVTLKAARHRAHAGVCLVEIEGARSFIGFMRTPVSEGMKVFTNTKR